MIWSESRIHLPLAPIGSPDQFFPNSNGDFMGFNQKKNGNIMVIS